MWLLNIVRLLFDVSDYFKNHSWEIYQKSDGATITKEEMLSYYKLNNEERSFTRKSRQLIDRIPISSL